MSKKRYMPPKGKKKACQPAVPQTASVKDCKVAESDVPEANTPVMAASAKACEVAAPRISIRNRFIRVEGHYSAFGDEYRDGKVFFHHHDQGSCWEEGFTAQDLREIADAMDRKDESR